MPLIALKMANALKVSTQGITNASDALTAFGNKLSTQIMLNGSISISITLTPSNADNQAAALTHLQTEIYNGVILGQYPNSAAPPPFLPYAPIPHLVLTMGVTDNRNTAFLDLSTQICNWINAWTGV